MRCVVVLEVERQGRPILPPLPSSAQHVDVWFRRTDAKLWSQPASMASLVRDKSQTLIVVKPLLRGVILSEAADISPRCYGNSWEED